LEKQDQENSLNDMSYLADIPPAQPDAAFSLIANFKADTTEHKVDLCPGFYRDDNAEPWVLPSVAQVQHDKIKLIYVSNTD
jgi:aspartate/tyrosine/aromatic aminotransferase